jgi:cytochrome c oxidase subunit 2
VCERLAAAALRGSGFLVACAGRRAFACCAATRPRRFFIGAVAVAAALSVRASEVAAAAPADRGSATVSSVFAPVSTPAASIHELSLLVIGICAAIFIVVGGLLAYTIVRFRRRGDDLHEPPQVYGSYPIELAWTVVPLMIVFVLILATTRTIGQLQKTTAPPHALQVTVVGHQWWWEFRYPSLGITTANELHVPVSTSTNPRPTFLTLESDDVVHSFWVPRLAGKTDVIPNWVNHMWIEPWETGTYLGQCAEFCGLQHAHMLIRVVVQSAADFDRWAAAQEQPAAVDPRVDAGRRLFQSTACVNCHTIGGTAAQGTFGPDLTHLISRHTIGAGTVLNTPANLSQWVRDPQQIKPGCLMPAMQLSDDEVNEIVAYLLTLK